MSEESDKEKEEIKRIQEHLTALGEYWDNLQIFVNRTSSDGEGDTIAISLGVGDWYSRYGQVKKWTIKREELARMEARDDEDSED